MSGLDRHRVQVFPDKQIRIPVPVDQLTLSRQSWSGPHLDYREGLAGFVRPSVEAPEDVAVDGQFVGVYGGREFTDLDIWVFLGAPLADDLDGPVVGLGVVLRAEFAGPTGDPLGGITAQDIGGTGIGRFEQKNHTSWISVVRDGNKTTEGADTVGFRHPTSCKSLPSFHQEPPHRFPLSSKPFP